MILQIYSTCPQSKDVPADRYAAAVAETARWSEAAGCTGMLVYTDNGIADPWLVAQTVLTATERLAPLVAVQPVYMHPYTAASMVSSLAYLHGRPVHLNMLAGGFRNDLIALGDQTEHDDRYARTVEYTQILLGLLRGETVSCEGRWHQVRNLRLAPALPPHLMPEVLISGSSPAGAAAAAEIGAVPIRYPAPLDQDVPDSDPAPGGGVRVGIIAREDAAEAWRVAEERFPCDRAGQVAHAMAMRTSDSHWHHQLARAGAAGPATAADSGDGEPDPYWLGPFKNYQTFCPYLVGSYDRVGAAVAHYVDQGTRVFVLDIPPSAEELDHIGTVFPGPAARVSPPAGRRVRSSERLQDYLTHSAERSPEATALVLGDEVMTYGELEASANRLAHALVEQGCKPGDRVAVLAAKTPWTIAALIAVLRAGGAYVPVDSASPAARVARIVRAAEPSLLLADATATALVDGLVEEGIGDLAVGALAEPLAGQRFASVFARDDLASLPVQTPAAASPDLAHLLFTSGSTGVPKGVMIEHANVVAFVEWALRHFATRAGDRISGHPPLHFDLSTFDIYATLAAGAELHLVPASLGLDPKGTARFIRDHELTQWFSVPSVLTYLARFDAVAQHDFPSLERLLWCGEVLPTPVLAHWMRRLPHVRFTNLYGPTEATIASSFYDVPEVPPDESVPVPIGLPCDGESLVVLDGDTPAPVGEIGELHIGGVGLSPGYWRDEEKTAAAFRADPRDPTQRIYRTGDLARVDEEGIVHFLGRTDSQIKSRGYRIELGEIESAVNTVAGVRECAVVGVDIGGFEGTTICCAYSVADAAELPIADVRRHLTTLVPRYMLPARWEVLDALPKNVNGKIDRPALREWFSAAAAPARSPGGRPDAH